MKRVAVIALLLLVTFTPTAFANPREDFGVDIITVTTSFNITNDKGLRLDISDALRNLSNNRVVFSVDGMTCTFGINPKTRNICYFSLSANVNDLEGGKANTFGYIIGNIGSNFAEGKQWLLDASDKIGLTDNAIYTKDKYDASALIDDIRYGMTVAGEYTKRTTFEMYVADEIHVEHDVRIDKADVILENMLASGSIEIAGKKLFDADTDPNGLIGTEGGYSSKITFIAPNISADGKTQSAYDIDNGGSIEVYKNTSDAILRMNKLTSISYFYPTVADRVYIFDNTILRLSQYMPKGTQAAFVEAFIAAL